MWPAATFGNYVHIVKVMRYLWCDTLLMVIVTCAAGESSHNNGVALCHRLDADVVKFELMVLDQRRNCLVKIIQASSLL
jgi:hypothetical protein